MKKVLICDDDTDILHLVRLTLETNGYKVRAVSGWQQLDEAIQTFHPDMLLLDVGLNGADGRAICKRLKADPATRHLTVVLFSAHANLKESIGECNADGYIAKPYDLREFLDTIRSHTQEEATAMSSLRRPA